MKTIIIATKNKGKVKEFETLFSPYGIKVKSLLDYNLIDIDETGSSFKENALLKARTISILTNEAVLADDSGLCVDYLNGEPGIYSARYAGVHGNDELNNKKLLDKLNGVANDKRTARFVCALAYVDGEYSTTVEGYCEGSILEELVGENGFGYDPLFYVNEVEKSMALLSKEEKAKISHRFHAFDKLKATLGLN